MPRRKPQFSCSVAGCGQAAAAVYRKHPLCPECNNDMVRGYIDMRENRAKKKGRFDFLVDREICHDRPYIDPIKTKGWNRVSHLKEIIVEGQQITFRIVCADCGWIYDKFQVGFNNNVQAFEKIVMGKAQSQEFLARMTRFHPHAGVVDEDGEPYDDECASCEFVIEQNVNWTEKEVGFEPTYLKLVVDFG